MSRSLRLFLAFAFAVTTIVGTPAVAQLPQLTPEQQQLLGMLPADQREALIRQYQDLQRQTGQSSAQGQEGPRGDQTATPETAVRGMSDVEQVDPKLIRPNDTLVVEIRAPENEPDHPNLLIGRHVVTLDRFGRLTLPGVAALPVAGLDPEQAALRLRAEASLQELSVRVTRLTLDPVGRESLKPFGYQVFRQVRAVDPYFFELATPVPGDYRVAPGDQVKVAFFGKEFSQFTLTVTREGTLLVPNLGPIPVAGMRYSEMKELIEARIREQTIGVQASVSMGELGAIEVFVLGDVTRPGVHTLTSLSSVADALIAAEGISDAGSLRDVRVIREGAVKNRIDFYKLLIEGEPVGDLRLQSGDVVFVPTTGPRAGVVGETRRPAWYELRGKTTAGSLLDYAGGHSPEADLHRAQIERIGDDGLPSFVDLDLTTDAGRATVIRDGDLLVLNRIVADAQDAVRLRGYFNHPGPRQWSEGLRLSDIVPDRTLLRSDPDLDYGLVVRQLADGRGVSIEVFSPRRVFTEPGSVHDIELYPRDEILMFGFDDYVGRRMLVEPLIDRLRRQATRDSGARIAQVAGAVRAPGRYPLAEGMTLADLVRAGGGLAEAAYLDEAEVTRFEVVDGRQREIEHMTVNLGIALGGDPAADLVVQPNDVLTVKQLSLWTERGTIELRGEVTFPGTYPIRPGEKLSAVLERAGGLTELAYPRAAVFTRETLRRKEQEQIDQMIRRLEADSAAAGTASDPTSQQARSVSNALATQLRATRPVGRLVIDMEDLMANPGDQDADVLVKDGDALVIPPRPQEVTVFGEVYFPTSHVYERGLSHKDYLERSGGATYRADTKRIYVVRANGSVETVSSRFGRGESIRAGDTIVVPLDAERLPPLVRLSSISQIVYQLGVAAAAWNTIGVF